MHSRKKDLTINIPSRDAGGLYITYPKDDKNFNRTQLSKTEVVEYAELLEDSAPLWMREMLADIEAEAKQTNSTVVIEPAKQQVNNKPGFFGRLFCCQADAAATPVTEDDFMRPSKGFK